MSDWPTVRTERLIDGYRCVYGSYTRHRARTRTRARCPRAIYASAIQNPVDQRLQFVAKGVCVMRNKSVTICRKRGSARRRQVDLRRAESVEAIAAEVLLDRRGRPGPGRDLALSNSRSSMRYRRELTAVARSCPAWIIRRIFRPEVANRSAACVTVSPVTGAPRRSQSLA
jgi:hypothetical protein